MTEKGFTLIEILVVLVIVALLAVSVMLRAGSEENQSARAVANRLRSILVYTEQKAVLQPATLGFDFDRKNGYQFLIFNEKLNRWDQLNSDSVLRPYRLPPRVQVDILAGTKEDNKNKDADKDNSDDKSSTVIINPSIVFYPSGEITSFKMNIGDTNKKNMYQITGDSNGAIQAVKTP